MPTPDEVPDWLRQLPAANPAGPGLWVARESESPFAAALGFERVREPVNAWPDRLMGKWMISSEYLEIETEADVSSAALRVLLHRFTRDDLLVGLAVLNRIASSPADVERLFAHVSPYINPAVVERMRLLMSADDEHKRLLVTRPTILRTMRYAAEHAPVSEEVRLQYWASIGEPDEAADLLTTATLLTHVVGELMGGREQADPSDRIGGLPTGLAMQLVCTGMSTRSENAGNLIGRTRLLYGNYGSLIHRHPARKPPSELVAEALGMSLDEVLTLAFCYYANSQTGDPFTTTPLQPLSFTNLAVTQVAKDNFIAHFSQTPEELAQANATHPGDWEMGAIQQRPLLRLRNGVVVMDAQFLLERATRGLYWFIHDHEKKVHGDPARERWNQAHGEMHELLVEDYLKAFAPVLVGGGSAVFDEDDLSRVFDGQVADFGMDFGDCVVIVDAQGGQLSVKAREEADVDAFERDLDRMVFQKAKQLDSTASNLLADPQPAGSPLVAPAARVFPVVVPGGAFPTLPVTAKYIRETLLDRGLLQHPRTSPLAVLDLRDLEHAEGVRLRDGKTLPDLLRAWQESDYSQFSLSDYLIQVDIDQGTDLPRPGRLAVALDRSFDAILSSVPDEASDPEAGQASNRPS